MGTLAKHAHWRRKEKRECADLETYVYSMRDAISSTLSEYVADEEKTAFAALLSSEEEWLYTDEGYDGDKKTFVRRLSTLQEQGLVFESR